MLVACGCNSVLSHGVGMETTLLLAKYSHPLLRALRLLDGHPACGQNSKVDLDLLLGRAFQASSDGGRGAESSSGQACCQGGVDGLPYCGEVVCRGRGKNVLKSRGGGSVTTAGRRRAA